MLRNVYDVYGWVAFALLAGLATTWIADLVLDACVAFALLAGLTTTWIAGLVLDA